MFKKFLTNVNDEFGIKFRFVSMEYIYIYIYIAAINLYIYIYINAYICLFDVQVAVQVSFSQRRSFYS